MNRFLSDSCSDVLNPSSSSSSSSGRSGHDPTESSAAPTGMFVSTAVRVENSCQAVWGLSGPVHAEWVFGGGVGGKRKRKFWWILCPLSWTPHLLSVRRCASPCWFARWRSCCCLSESRLAWGERSPHRRTRTTRKVCDFYLRLGGGGNVIQWNIVKSTVNIWFYGWAIHRPPAVGIVKETESEWCFSYNLKDFL